MAGKFNYEIYYLFYQLILILVHQLSVYQVMSLRHMGTEGGYLSHQAALAQANTKPTLPTTLGEKHLGNTFRQLSTYN